MEACAQEAPPPGQDQEVLTHGPVHEAFAEPTAANPGAPLVVPKMPADPIEELPPDVKPDGANVVWITGYWAWDDTRNDFIWVSGIWRDAPPGYVWVAGYWNQVAGGAQWTPGFWSPAQQEQVSYLPEPPQSPEAGPNTPQPSADDFWVPGNYQYVDARYVWRPGYWTVARPDWIWTPAHFIWSPSGYIFIPGHWDYALARRGVLFAPVYFAGPVYLRRHFVFGPSVVIDSNLLTVNFFVRPNYHHYYFGDYYGQNFVTLGFTPWFSVGVRTGYDPLFTYYRWDHRDDRHWQEGLHEHYAYMNTHPEARPPRTFVQQTTIINNNITIKNSNNRTIAIGAPLNQYVKSNGGGTNTKFVAVSNVQREQIAQQAVKSQDFTRGEGQIRGHPWRWTNWRTESRRTAQDDEHPHDGAIERADSPAQREPPAAPVARLREPARPPAAREPARPARVRPADRRPVGEQQARPAAQAPRIPSVSNPASPSRAARRGPPDQPGQIRRVRRMTRRRVRPAVARPLVPRRATLAGGIRRAIRAARSRTTRTGRLVPAMAVS